MPITLTIEQGEAQTIIDALGELPHRVTRGLIDKIYKQANEQIAAELGEEPPTLPAPPTPPVRTPTEAEAKA